MRNSVLARDATAESDAEDKTEQSAAYSDAVLDRLKNPGAEDDSCIICFEPMENQVLIKTCSHTG